MNAIKLVLFIIISVAAQYILENLNFFVDEYLFKIFWPIDRKGSYDILRKFSNAMQEIKKYYVLLSSNTGTINTYNGYLELTQCGSENPVQIDAEIEWLPPGWHRFELREINENTTNCNSLGPMVDLGFDTLFDLLDEYIDGSGTSNFTKVTRSLTLEPNDPRTLIGRAIAFFQELEIGFNRSERHLNIACGSVLATSEYDRKTKYYVERISQDPEYNLAHVWY